MESPIRRAALPGLTALRFFAASYVLVAHFEPAQPSNLLFPTLTNRLLSAGFTAVSCFFILSGFILAYTHEQVPNLRRFYRARFARIYPLYLFALIVSLPLLFKFPDVLPRPLDRIAALVTDLLLVQDWIPRYAHSINLTAWTLSCEAFFYLIFPFVVRRIGRLRRYSVALLAGCWLWQIAPPLLNAYWLRLHHPAFSSLLSDLLTMPVARLGEFFAGIVLGLRFLHRPDDQSGMIQPAPSWLLPVSLAFCLVCLSFNKTVPDEVTGNGLMVAPYALLIWALANSRSAYLASSPLQLGGEISYGVYLLQIPFAHFLFLLERLTGGRTGGAGWWMLALYPTAWLTYVGIEKPCRALLLHRRP